MSLQRCCLSGGRWELTRSTQADIEPDWGAAIGAAVPGGVLADLERAGEIPDCFQGENFRDAAFAADLHWWYRRRFTAEELGLIADPHAGSVRTELVFDGIDTYGQVWLNGQTLGRVNDMFRRYRFDVSEHLDREGPNELVVRIDPVCASARDWAARHGIDLESREVVFGIRERLVARKMQMSFGWDNCPTLLAGGLFRDVWLEQRRGPTLGEMSWAVSGLDVERDRAQLVFQGELAPGERGGVVRIEGRAEDGHTFAGQASVDAQGRWAVTIHVAQPRLWWPNGHGEPHLYTTRVQLLEAGDGRLCDERELPVGIRTIEVRQAPVQKRRVGHRIGRPRGGADGVAMDGGDLGPWTKLPLDEPIEVEVRPMIFRVNGRELFIKGACWQTPDVLPGRVDEARIDTLLDAAVDAHVNMIRLWGGGTIEPDCFYESCSRRGLLVWQDFHFACAQYPTDEAFLALIQPEIEDIIRRLRNHPCLACWCGDNESDMMDHDAGLDPAANPINKRLIPRTLARLDPQRRYYHASTPSGGDHPRSDWGGDKRNWGPWHPQGNFRHIREEEARFISECGTYALPAMETIARFMPEPWRWPLDHPTWRLHWGDLAHYSRGFDALTRASWSFVHEPTNLAEAVEVSQFVHGWGLKLLIERCRQRMGECGGILLWKLDDAWPCVDGGLFDYDLHPRLALDFVREAYKPIAVSMSQDPQDPSGEVTLWLASDLPRDVAGQLTTRLLSVSEAGEAALLEQRRSRALARGGAATPCETVEVAGHDASRLVIEAQWISDDGTATSTSRFTLDPAAAYRYHRGLKTAQAPLSGARS